MTHHLREHPDAVQVPSRHGPTMELAADIAQWSLLLLGLLLFACQLGAHRLGYLLGTRRRVARGDGEADSISLVVTSLLGLLAFTLALTLSYGSARFAERRAATLSETDAIGTALQRAEALGDPRGDQIAGLMRQYGELRRAYVVAPRNSPAIDDINRRSASLQSEMWALATPIVRERHDPIAAAFMTGLDDAFDAGTAERFAMETKFPSQLFWLLIGMALVSMAAIGFQLGTKGHEIHLLVATLIAVWTAAFIVILDLSAPRIGSTSTAVYDWMLQDMRATDPRPVSAAK